MTRSRKSHTDTAWVSLPRARAGDLRARLRLALPRLQCRRWGLCPVGRLSRCSHALPWDSHVESFPPACAPGRFSPQNEFCVGLLGQRGAHSREVHMPADAWKGTSHSSSQTVACASPGILAKPVFLVCFTLSFLKKKFFFFCCLVVCYFVNYLWVFLVCFFKKLDEMGVPTLSIGHHFP